MMTILGFNVALIISQFFSLAIAAQSGSTIEGRVTGPNRQGIVNARVSLQDDGYSERQMLYTDNSGRYRFKGVPSGVIYLVVEAMDGSYEKETRRIEVNPINLRRDTTGKIRGGETFYEDFSLKPKKMDGGMGAAMGKPVAVFAQQVPESAKKEYETGVKNFEQNNAAEGIAALKHAIELFPDYYDALDRLGGEYVRQRNFAVAIPLLEHSTQVNKDSWSSFYYLGVAQLEASQGDAGIHSLRRAVELNPNSVNVNMRLGMALAKDPQTHTEAIEAMKKVAQLAGKQVPDCYLYLAQLYAKQTKYKEAADALETYVKMTPQADATQREQYKKLIEQLRRKAKV